MRPDGSKAYVLADNKWVFRSFRVQTLYEGLSDQLVGADQEPSGQGDQQRAGEAGLAALMDGTTASDLLMELPSAFQGLDVAITQFTPSDSCRIVSPVFFGLADGTPTTPGGPSQDAVDQVFAGLGDGTDDTLWTL